MLFQSHGTEIADSNANVQSRSVKDYRLLSVQFKIWLQEKYVKGLLYIDLCVT